MDKQYQDFLNDCWSNHDKDSKKVAKNLKDNLNLLDSTDKISGYCKLIIHTLGGHLGQWQEAKDLLISITKLKSFTKNDEVYTGLAVISLCMDDEDEFQKHIKLVPKEGSLTRIYAATAVEQATRGWTDKAIKSFDRAIASVPNNLSKGHSVAKELAICANNLALQLEEKQHRSSLEVELMLKSATASRKYWEIAGSWLQIERAEYRISISHLKVGNHDKALHHARLCESICKENNADSFETFFAHEALTRINRVICEKLKSEVNTEWQSYCVIP